MQKMRKFLSRWKVVTTGVAVPLLGGALILFSIWLNSRLIDQSEGAQNLPERVQVQAMLSRIGLENILAAGVANRPSTAFDQDVGHQIDGAVQACNQALQQSPYHFFMSSVVGDTAARARLIELKNRLNQLRTESAARYHDDGTSPTAGEARANYERAYAAVGMGTREARLAIDRLVTHQRFNLVWLNAGSLAIVFGLFSLSSL